MIDLTVKTLDSQNHAFSLEDDQITVRGFKEYIAESVAVPADSQRLIYCGRVLQDERKLRDYDVNGKVIHLVQRAPPRPGQRRNNGGQSRSQNHGSQVWQNPQRTHYRLTRTQMHGNAMYLGAMSIPAEMVEGHGLSVPQLSNSLSNSRLIVARRMLDRANSLMDRLDDPTCPLNPPSSGNNQPPLAQQMQVQQLETEHYLFSTNDGGINGHARLAEAAASAIAVAIAAGGNNVALFRGNSEEGAEAGPASDTNDDNQSDAQQSQSEQEVLTSSNDEQSTERGSQARNDASRRTHHRFIIAEGVPTNLMGTRANNITLLRGNSDESGEAGPVNDAANDDNQSDVQQLQPSQSEQLPRPPQMAELLERLLNTQDRLRPYIERYRHLMQTDPSIPPVAGSSGVEENQRIVDGVSESLHYMSHACHALSDIIVDMGQQPPRNLRCRPVIIQHSAILQPGIEVEARIRVYGRNANNNNGNEENGDSASGPAQSDLIEASTDEGNQQQEAEPNPQQQTEQQEQLQSPFGTVFNLPNNLRVLMEVSPESNMDAASGSELTQTGETNNNNNNNNGARVGGAAGTFPWGLASPTDFIRNIMQAVAGHMVQGGINTTAIPTQNPPTVGGQQAVSSLDGNTNAGQSTQARSNVGTHPTTATHTRSTSRPHVFHQQAHPLGVGMSLGQGLDFDPFLPCNSHHVRRTSTTTSTTATSTSSGTRTSQAPTTETQSQAQTATTSTTASNTSSTNTTPVSTSQTANADLPFMNLLQQAVDIDLAESLGHLMQMLNSRNIHVETIGGSIRVGNRPAGTLTLAELLLPFSSVPTAQNSRSEEHFFMNLSVLMLQNMTLIDLIRLRIGDPEPIARVRRPLQEFFQNNFPNTTTDVLQVQATERLVAHLRPHLHVLLTSEEVSSGRSGSHIDICATVEALLRRHVMEILLFLFDSEVTDTRFGQETINIVNNGVRQLCAVLRYYIRGGQAELEAIVSRCLCRILDGSPPLIRHWTLNLLRSPYHAYLMRATQPPDSEILPLLVYKDVPSEQSTVPSAAAHQPSQTQSTVEPMETEVVEERTTFEASVPDDGEEVPETFPGHEALPSDWVPIIARDGVRQRRQLQMQGMNGGVAAFSDAYLGTLPTKRRKLIEQQKPRLLVSPTPNHSAIAASMERLVREGVTRAGVEEVEGAAVAVAVDPGVRRAFGQAIRDCLNPRRYGTPDFPDPLRFPNATKYFADQDRQPK